MSDSGGTQKALGGGALAIGALAAVAPSVFLGMYGATNDVHVRTMTRLWGSRTAALGVLAFILDGDANQRNWANASAAVHTADAMILAASSGIPARPRVLGALTAALFAGAAAYSAGR